LDAKLEAVKAWEYGIEMHRKAGEDFPQDILSKIEAGKNRIAELTEDLAQRAKQQSIVDSGKVVVT
jgi:hypothetical protein